jgi:ADP-ribosylglycohydrolase
MEVQKMSKDVLMVLRVIAIGSSFAFVAGCQAPVRRITADDYADKMKAGWIGQMAGVGWGGPTEFHYRGQIMPADKMPAWKPETVNQFNQDDIYVEMTFLRTLELYGMDVPIRQAGIDFANSGYRLWHANRNGRDNLRKGIAPPDSGHPRFNKHADDIDYQIESDYSGLIAPGMPNVPIALGEKFGRLMNYGDGVYAGQFIGGMYAEAFFDNNMERIVRAALACIPSGSQYAECIRDVLAWHRQNPDDWQKTWRLIEKKYHDNPNYRRFSCDKGAFDIDAKINGAYVVTGLLYGNGDPDKTITIATRCGQDSDCNPSSAGGVLFTTIGFKNLPARFKSALDPDGKFSHTPYNFPTLVEVSKKLVRQSVTRAGGRIEKNAEGQEVFVIPVKKPKPGRLEQCWKPGPIANSRFTAAEMARIKVPEEQSKKP